MPEPVKFTVDVESTDTGFDAVQKALEELFNHEVLVGIPQENNGRAAEDSISVTNAELLYIHTYGSPINNIPARPVLEAAIEHDKDQISKLLQDATDAALSGSIDGVHGKLEEAGTQGANLARAWFTNPANHWAKNADITVDGGWMKNKVSGRPFKVKGKGSDRPLIDTGEMRKSITYKVKRTK